MKLRTRLLLTILLWFSLPMLLLLYFWLTSDAGVEKPEIILILYTVFSWSIALLAFVMESARRQILSSTVPSRSAWRLGSYGCFAVMLAILTSPWLGGAKLNELLSVIGLVFAYCFSMGYLYARYIQPETVCQGDKTGPA